MKIAGLETGIEKVLREGDTSSFRMPELCQLIPSGAGLENRLDSILGSDSLDTLILSSLMPQLNNKEILLPSVYRRMAAKIQEHLRRSIHGSLSPEKRAVLEKAAALLDSKEELFDLLSFYRRLLIQA